MDVHAFAINCFVRKPAATDVCIRHKVKHFTYHNWGYAYAETIHKCTRKHDGNLLTAKRGAALFG